MSGILEQINDKLDRIIAFLPTLSPGVPASTAAQTVAVAAAQPAAIGLGSLGGLTAATAKVVTADMIETLITPHVANEAVKAALQAQMQAMGIGALGDTRPDQYAELYQRFEAVIGGAAAPAASSSII